MFVISLMDLNLYGPWYEMAHDYIWRNFEEPELLCDLISSFSPNSRTRFCVQRALRMHRMAMEGHGLLDWERDMGIMTSHRKNIQRSLKGEPLSGHKVSRFAQNLRGNYVPVTIDVWMCRAYKMSPKLNLSQYRQLERDVQVKAINWSVEPATYQAAVWMWERRRHGHNDLWLHKLIEEVMNE